MPSTEEQVGRSSGEDVIDTNHRGFPPSAVGWPSGAKHARHSTSVYHHTLISRRKETHLRRKETHLRRKETHLRRKEAHLGRKEAHLRRATESPTRRSHRGVPEHGATLVLLG